MGKKTDDVEDLAAGLVDDVTDDREKLSGFFDKLLQVDDVCMVAEQVAKIADALTRQNHLRADVLKAKLRASSKSPGDDATAGDFDKIGQPFVIEEEGGN